MHSHRDYSKGPLRSRLEEAHRKRKEIRELRLRGPIYHSLEEARRANDSDTIVHHKVEAMGNKLFRTIPLTDFERARRTARKNLGL